MKYDNLKITGTVSIERCDSHDLSITKGMNILLMGPTGAGKSTFIEALGGPTRDLNLSSGNLEGFTQSISAYELKNVTQKRWYGTRTNEIIYLLDTPGFADTKISERAIVSMITKWREDHNYSAFTQILYFTPITHVRLPGSQRRVIRTFKAITGLDTAENIVIVSTMWDNIGGESAMRRADARFEQLGDEIWKDFIEKGARICKFENTSESALSVLDYAFDSATGAPFNLENDFDTIRSAPFVTNLFDDLNERIHSLSLQQRNIEDELADPSTLTNEELVALLVSQHAEVVQYIGKFNQELQGLYTDVPHPSPPQVTSEAHMESVAQRRHEGKISRALRALKLKR